MPKQRPKAYPAFKPIGQQLQPHAIVQPHDSCGRRTAGGSAAQMIAQCIHAVPACYVGFVHAPKHRQRRPRPRPAHIQWEAQTPQTRPAPAFELCPFPLSWQNAAPRVMKYARGRTKAASRRRPTIIPCASSPHTGKTCTNAGGQYYYALRGKSLDLTGSLALMPRTGKPRAGHTCASGVSGHEATSSRGAAAEEKACPSKPHPPPE